MAVSEDFLTYVQEQLAGIDGLSSRRMFGGVGLYSGDRFFGLLADNTLYLKADDLNRGDFLARGMQPFRPYRNRPELSMSYYAVPADVLEDADTLLAWARRAVRSAVASPGRGKPRRGRAKF